MLNNSREKSKSTKPENKKEFECKIKYLMRNSCSRCPKNRECEESDRDERDNSRQDKKLSNSVYKNGNRSFPKKNMKTIKKK